MIYIHILKMNRKKNIIITGCCGFIGFSLSIKLLSNKNLCVIGIDTIDDYYDVNLKKNRLKLLRKIKIFNLKKLISKTIIY